ncbi:Mannan polymerase II complex ANP1 subunit [Verticillium dahliae VDG1]|nr:Mannan polymerase II complex ANP1 subunit [Verticillium dahliae VDG1]
MAGRIVVRPCGQLEQYSTSRHSLGIYFGVSTTCRYHVPSEDNVPSEHSNTMALRPAIEQAVAQVVLKQPFMRVGITGEDTKQPNFVHVPVINLSTQIRWLEPIEVASADAMLEKLLAVQLGTRWPDLDTRPPWKVTVVPLNARDGHLTALDIVYTFHHAIGDGTSSAIFHKQLLEALSKPAPVPSLSSAGLLTLSEPAILPPPQEELINFSISWPFFLRTLWKAFGPDFLKAKPNPVPWTGNHVNLANPFQTNSALMSGPAMTLNLAGVVGGEISGTMTWQEKTVDAELVEGVVNDLAEWSRRLAEEGTLGL